MPKTVAPPDPIAMLAREIASLEKEIGPGKFHPASEEPPVRRLPFRNPHMNYATQGGAPWDRVVALYGDESTGKSLCAFELVAMAQDLPDSAEVILWPRIQYHREMGHIITAERLSEELEWTKETFPDGALCAWHDPEGQFDKVRAHDLGVDLDALYIGESMVIEEYGYILPFGYRNFNLQVIDSTSAASSNLQLKEEPGKSLIGVDARQWKSVLKNCQVYFGPLNNGVGMTNMLVMIHQMGTHVKTGGSKPVAARFLKHTSSLSIKFSRGAFLWDKGGGVMTDGKVEGSDKNSMAGRAEPNGVEVFAQVEKSRTCRPFRIGSMHFDFRTVQYSHIAELASSGIYHGLIKKSGSYYRIEGDEKSMQGLAKVYQRLREDDALCKQILCRLLDFEDDSRIKAEVMKAAADDDES